MWWPRSNSLSLLMNCVHDDIGATIKPMGAVMQEGARGRKWRCLPFSDVRFRRRNFLYSLPPERLTTVAAIVASELKETARELVENQAGSDLRPSCRTKPQAVANA